MINAAAVALIQDIFEAPELFSGAHRIHKRVVAWGRDEEARIFEHSAVVVSEETLLAGLKRRNQDEVEEVHPAWTVLSSNPLPAIVSQRRFGTRRASAVRVLLRESTDASNCWIESLELGWLFLIPISSTSAWLLSIGESAHALLSASRVIRARVQGVGGDAGEFPAYPRIVTPLCGEGWLACGTAAMAFDPICGDGTAHAIREAILAAAVIRAAIQGSNVRDLLNHYEARLTAGFERHLKLCMGFYRSGYGGLWWDQEASSLEEGIRWCASKSLRFAQYRYRLDGLELKPAC